MTSGPFTSFVGRRELLADVRERLSTSRVVTLVGQGGVGKSRTALRVVDLVRRARASPDGIWVVPLEDLTTADLLAPTIGEAVGLQIEETPVGPDTLTDYIADRKALLLLDNCEHLYREVGGLVTVLRAACPNLHMLVTSRRPLVISGEDVVQMPALTCPADPAAAEANLQAVGHYEAVQLFVERARAAGSDFELTPANVRAVSELCAELEGNPLAIELAAGRTRMFTPQEVLDRLHERFPMLSTGYHDAHDRHRSLLACVEWSYSLCTPAERALWDRVWVFSGGFVLDAAADVCRLDDQDVAGEVTLLEVLGALVDQSVVGTEVDVAGATRYRMSADVREYGLGAARAVGAEARMRERHVRWCSRMAAEFCAGWAGPGQAARLARLEAEHANVRAALHHARTEPALVQVGLVIATDLEMFWSASGRLGEARTWYDALLASGEVAAGPAARAAVVAARFAVLQGDGGAAREQLARAHLLGLDDPATRGRSLVSAAVLAGWDGDLEQSLSDVDQAVRLLTGTTDTSGLLVAHLMAGITRNAAGDSRGAEESLRACVDLAAEVGEEFVRAFALNGLGDLAAAAGDADRATDLYRQALEVKHRLGDRVGIAVAFDSMGRLAMGQGRGRRAALLLGAAEGVWDTVGMSQSGNVLVHTRAREPGIGPVQQMLGTQDFRRHFRRGSRLEVDDAVALALDSDLDDAIPEATEGDPERTPLTKRELEVADLVAEGLSNPEIAARLVISVRTAQGHVENILRKLGFGSRSLIAAWVAERRLGQTQQ